MHLPDSFVVGRDRKEKVSTLYNKETYTLWLVSQLCPSFLKVELLYIKMDLLKISDT